MLPVTQTKQRQSHQHIAERDCQDSAKAAFFHLRCCQGTWSTSTGVWLRPVGRDTSASIISKRSRHSKAAPSSKTFLSHTAKLHALGGEALGGPAKVLLKKGLTLSTCKLEQCGSHP
eukprot:5534307-Amphidinium_carterae.1